MVCLSEFEIEKIDADSIAPHLNAVFGISTGIGTAAIDRVSGESLPLGVAFIEPLVQRFVAHVGAPTMPPSLLILLSPTSGNDVGQSVVAVRWTIFAKQVTTVDHAAQRRSQRVVRNISLIISTVSSDGAVVEGVAETLVVGKHGARIHTNVPLLLGAVVKIKVSATGRQAEAIVTWVSSESVYEFGLELLRPTDIWGSFS